MQVKIKKVLNNNAVIIIDDGEEKIAIGSGVGFNKRKNDVAIKNKIEKLFVLQENAKFEQLLERIPEEHYVVTEEIIKHAEAALQAELNNHIRVVLTDHISFAIERQREGIELKNKLLNEIKILYRKEFEIGLWAIQLIKDRLGVEMPVDEAGFVALHIHTTKVKGGDIHETVRFTAILADVIDFIKQLLGISFKENDISYDRLVTHLHFAIIRYKQGNLHTMDTDMFKMIQSKYPSSYRCALEVANELFHTHQIKLPEEELGYIALHIERLKKESDHS